MLRPTLRRDRTIIPRLDIVHNLHANYWVLALVALQKAQAATLGSCARRYWTTSWILSDNSHDGSVQIAMAVFVDCGMEGDSQYFHRSIKCTCIRAG